MLLENTSELSQKLQEAFPEATITKRAFLGGLLTSAIAALELARCCAVSDWEDEGGERVEVDGEVVEL